MPRTLSLQKVLDETDSVMVTKVENLRKAIRGDYHHNWIIDNLPAASITEDVSAPRHSDPKLLISCVGVLRVWWLYFCALPVLSTVTRTVIRIFLFSIFFCLRLPTPLISQKPTKRGDEGIMISKGSVG